MWYLDPGLAQLRHAGVYRARQNIRGRASPERGPSGETAAGDCAQREEISTLVHGLAPQSFRRDVSRRAEHTAVHSGGDERGDPKISELDRSVAAQQHVARLDVAVQQIDRVGRGERAREGPQKGHGQLRAEPARVAQELL